MQAAAKLPARKTAGNGKKQNRKAVKIVSYGIVGLLAVIILSIVCYLFLFKVNKIVVISDEMYTPEQLEQITDIHPGDNLFSFSSRQVSKTVSMSLSFVRECRVTRSITGTVTFRISIDKGNMYVILGSEYYVFNSNLLVLHKAKELEPEYQSSLMRVELKGIKKCIVGQKIVLDKADEIEVFNKVYQVLDRENLITEMSSIDVTDKFNITMRYKDKINIICGDYTQLENKILFALEILKNYESGTVDVSDTRLGSYVYSE